MKFLLHVFDVGRNIIIYDVLNTVTDWLLDFSGKQ
jgi:hypothetical protein